MTSQYGPLIEKIVNNEQTNFMRLGNVHMEQKKYLSTLNFGDTDAAFTLQLPQCATKAGIIEQSSKTYTDLLFDSSAHDVKELVDLLIAMEEEAAKQLHNRSGEWFEGDSGKMTVQSFEDMFTPVVRYVNRQRNVCVRVHIPTSSRGIKQASTGYDCDVYDKASKTRLLSDIRADTQILPLVEVKEIRMTSTSISLHLNLVECMIVRDSVSVQDDVKQRIPTRRLQLAGSSASDNQNEIHTEEPFDNNLSKENQETQQDIQQDIQQETHGESQNDELVAVEPSNNFDNAVLAKDAISELTDCNDDDAKKNEGYEIINEVAVKEDSNKVQENSIEAKGENVGDPNVSLSIEEVTTSQLEVESDNLEEIGVLEIDEAEPIKLKKPDEVYKDIYKAAITKAKKLRQVALEAYLDAKKIKAKFMLEDIFDSDDDGDEDEDEAELEEVTNLTVQ